MPDLRTAVPGDIIGNIVLSEIVLIIQCMKDFIVNVIE